jgi:hypothetical protein
MNSAGRHSSDPCTAGGGPPPTNRETNPMAPFYVYELVDPRDGSVFYVGKGKGRRISHHVRTARRGIVDNAEKFKRIQAIHDAGLTVGERIISRHVKEGDAYAAERDRITELRGELTNIVGGVVTNEERRREAAKASLARLKPYDEWVAGMRDDQRRSADFLGGPRYVYDLFCKHFAMVASGVDQQWAARASSL